MASNCGSEGLVYFSDPVATEKLKDKARKELNETAELVQEGLRQLRTLIKDHNVICITRDDFLLRFLRSNKFQTQRSFEALQNYAHQRVALNNFFLKLQPEIMRILLRLNVLGILPYRDSEGRLIFFYRTGIWNTDICSDEEMLATVFLLMNYAAEDQSTQISGVVLVLDHKCFSFANVTFFMRRINLIRTFLFKSLPARYPQIHCLNDSFLIKYVVQLVDAFLPKKIKTRIMFHGKGSEALLQHLPSAVLPNDFGGNYGPLSTDHLTEVLVEYLEKLKDEQQCFFEQNI